MFWEKLKNKSKLTCSSSAKKTEESEPENGQAVVEYLVVLAIAVGVALPLSKQLLSFIDGQVERVGGTLEKKLYTGRPGPHLWKN